MKRFILSILITITGVISAFGMSFSEAQEHAYYLTDKMAYELDLTPEQYDQVYQVNLEYLLNVRSSNPYNYYWDYRNADLSYILYDWQYSLYRAAEYFYRPIVRRHFSWYFPVWDRYSRSYYYYSRPTIYHSWHGGIWVGRTHHSPSPYYGHRPPTHHGGMAGHGGHPTHNPGLIHHNNGHNGNYNGGHNNGGHNNGGARPNGNNGGHNNGGARPNGNNGGHNNGGARPDNNNHGSRGGYNGSSSRGGSSTPSYRGGNSTSRGTSSGTTHSSSSSRSNSTPRSSATPSGSRGGSSSHSGGGNRSFGGGGRR